MLVEVCLTVDVEFSIGGAFTYPDTHSPIGEDNVLCVAAGQENGLGFLLDVLRDHGISATFFVETLQTHYFGDAPMGRVVERILRAGQDVQLHVHPAWRAFRDTEWRSWIPKTRPSDFCDARSLQEIQDILGDAVTGLHRLGCPMPIAMRTGNLHADRNVYRAMAASGLRLASNLGVAWWMPHDPELRLWGGRSWVEGVLEVPVTSYLQGTARGPRLLTTSASSFGEVRALLREAHRQEIPTVVILSHPFDFLGVNRLRRGGARRNQLVKRRMEKICAFIADNSDTLTSRSFTQAAPGWLASPSVAPPVLAAPIASMVARMAQNGINELVLSL